MPNINGISHFGIAVDDLERSERFYCDVLGGTIKTRHDGPNAHIGVILGNHGLDVFLRKAPGGDRWAYDGVPGGLHFAFDVSPSEIDGVLQHVRAQGLAVNHPVMHGGERREPAKSLSFYFEDPDGYALEFSVIYPTPEAAVADWERFGSHTRQDLKGVWGRRTERAPAAVWAAD